MTQNVNSHLGTYVALKPTLLSKNLILAYCRDNRITPARGLHCTLLYSRKSHDIDPSPDFHVCTPIGFDRFGTDEENILVLKLDAPTISARHHELRESFGATHDYPDFTPHITLCYDFTGDYTALQPFTFQLGFEAEEVRPLNLDWKP